MLLCKYNALGVTFSSSTLKTKNYKAYKYLKERYPGYNIEHFFTGVIYSSYRGSKALNQTVEEFDEFMKHFSDVIPLDDIKVYSILKVKDILMEHYKISFSKLCQMISKYKLDEEFVEYTKYKALNQYDYRSLYFMYIYDLEKGINGSYLLYPFLENVDGYFYSVKDVSRIEFITEITPQGKYPANIWTFLTFMNPTKNSFFGDKFKDKRNKLCQQLIDQGYQVSEYHLKNFRKWIDNLYPDTKHLDDFTRFLEQHAQPIDGDLINSYIINDEVDNIEFVCVKYGYYPEKKDIILARTSNSTRVLKLFEEIEHKKLVHRFYKY